MSKWFLVCFSVLSVAGTTHARAQGTPSHADVAVYAGGAWTSSWLEAGGQSFGIGFNPIFGGIAHWWASPKLGARLHLGYVPSDLPQPSGEDSVQIPDNAMHNWLYDLSLAVRPFAAEGQDRRLSAMYLFAGGGAFSPNVEGGETGQCVPPYDHGNACLPYGWREATVGQVTAGLGATAIPITPTLGIFVEGAIHAYSSPFRMGEEWTGRPTCGNPACLAEKRGGRTIRLVGGMMLAMGPKPIVPVVPLPPPPPAAPPEERPLTVCIAANGFPRYVDLMVRPEVGDTVVVTDLGVRRPFRSAFPADPPTASGLAWFEREEPVFLDGREYVRFGVPRELSAGEVVRIADYRGTPVFAGPDDRTDGYPTTILVPVRDGCIFQPFQMRERVRVRG